MDSQEAIDLFEEMMRVDDCAAVAVDPTICCGSNNNVYDETNALLTCLICYRSVPYQRYFTEYTYQSRRKSIYKPIIHFYFKLREISGALCPEDDEWRIFFEDEIVNTIRDVRCILKENNATHLNKYTYYIFKTINSEAALNIKRSDHEKMVHMFIKIHRAFKRTKDLNRKNLPNYHFIMEFILKQLGYEVEGRLCTPFLPASIKKNEEIFQLIIEELNKK